MAQHFRLSAAARTISLGQVLRMVDAEVETTFAPAIWWRLLHKSAVVDLGGGEQVLQEYGFDLDIVDLCADAGLEPLALYCLGPDEEDLQHALSIWEGGYFRPQRSLLILNEGAIRTGRTVAGAFEKTLK